MRLNPLASAGSVLHSQRTRRLEILAQDPTVTGANGAPLVETVEVPAEELDVGPRGHRVHVVDYDATSNVLYAPATLPVKVDLEDPAFHAQNAYAITMRTLARFESALGRHVPWSFYGHQLKVAPHAFADANAFYSSSEQALLLGYFRSSSGEETIYTCLSHDVIAHETTHALIDGLRSRYRYPSSADQAAFHEGFADVVAALSAFSLPGLVMAALRDLAAGARTVKRTRLRDKLPGSVLLKMAEQLGSELGDVRGSALRESASLPPSEVDLESEESEFVEPHRRGEVFVAAVTRALLEVWLARLDRGSTGEEVEVQRVADEGAAAADHLLSMVIRAIDYCPPTDILFGDFLSALLTADSEMWPDDAKYGYRAAIRRGFATFKIAPLANPAGAGIWDRWRRPLRYGRIHIDSLEREPEEVFRFLWENQKPLQLHRDAYTRVLSVHPCVRVGSDGFVFKETVAEYAQILTLPLGKVWEGKVPGDLDGNRRIDIYGGGVLVFDEWGRLKYHVHNRVGDRRRQAERLRHLHEQDLLGRRATGFRTFTLLGRRHAAADRRTAREEW